ncbi:hypothetical protein [Bradyrhizobium erythrophlei]|nr:hypothetical protein [Bradyrhizobium erythrophlei]
MDTLTSSLFAIRVLKLSRVTIYIGERDPWIVQGVDEALETDRLEKMRR